MKALEIGLLVLAMTTCLEGHGLGMGRGMSRGGAGMGYGQGRRCRGGRGRYNSRLYHNRIRCRLNLGSRSRGVGGMAVGEPFVPNNNNINNQDYEDEDYEEPCIGICLHLKMQKEAKEKAEREKDRKEEKQRRRKERKEVKQRQKQEREAEPSDLEEAPRDLEAEVKYREEAPKQLETEDAAELERQLQRQKPMREPERQDVEAALGQLLERKEKLKQKLHRDLDGNQEGEQINGIRNMEESPGERPEPCVGICYLKKLQQMAAEEARENQRKRNSQFANYEDYTNDDYYGEYSNQKSYNYMKYREDLRKERERDWDCPQEGLNTRGRSQIGQPTKVNTWEECSALCFYNQDCSLWTWVKPSAGGAYARNCAIMNGAQSTAVDRNVISGLNTCQGAPEMEGNQRNHINDHSRSPGWHMNEYYSGK